MIGSLMYLTSSRPDLVFVVCMCARYYAKPTEKNLYVVKQIFRYLKGTINMGLWYSKDSCIALTAFADADHAVSLPYAVTTSNTPDPSILTLDIISSRSKWKMGWLNSTSSEQNISWQISLPRQWDENDLTFLSTSLEIQQLSKGSSEGSGIIPEVPDEPKDNSGSSSSSLSCSDNEVQDSMVDVHIHLEDPAVQRTPCIDPAILMVTEKISSMPTPPTTQAQVTNVSESVSSSTFKQRHLELEMKVETMQKRAWT
ncbi:hypothetical protein Tco_1105700 [Tanacetum coccineum]